MVARGFIHLAEGVRFVILDIKKPARTPVFKPVFFVFPQMMGFLRDNVP